MFITITKKKKKFSLKLKKKLHLGNIIYKYKC